jgi:hypothetical protein
MNLTMEQKLSKFCIEFSDLVRIKNYPYQTYDGAVFYIHKSNLVFAWVPILNSSDVNAGEWRKG